LKKRQRVFVKTRRHISIIMQSSFLPVEEHPLEPFLPANAKLLMLGSFPPQKKRWSMDFFYPNLQNDMWRIFGLIFFDDKDRFLFPDKKAFDKKRLIEFLTEKGIALYDTASSVRRLQDNASDKFLEVVEPTDIRLLLKQLPQCKAIVTTGQKATDIIRSQIDVEEPKVGESCPFEFEDRTLRLYRMPSSSRAYPLAIEKKASVYRFMLNELDFLR
jgi:G:T/U-mismatch repair DNA glycosylase